jgi:hypothetical protein
MYQTREDWLTQAIEELRPLFDVSGFPLPDKIRVTCGFPSSKARALHRAIGEHWSPAASASGHHEILISPVMDDPFEVFGILVHELCHAATDGDGHGREFAKIARAMWLEGKLTETRIGDLFKANMSQLIESLGAYPHSKLNVSALRKPQATRMLKAVCPDCGYTIRLSKAWADKWMPVCPHDNSSFVLA